MPGQPGQGQPGQGDDEMQPLDQGDGEPDYQNMSTEDLEKELGKLQGKGSTAKSIEAKRASCEIML
jgi:hypothetical protein